MSLIAVVVYLLIIGVILYLINNVVPCVQWIKVVINAIIAISVLLWLLQVFGVHTGLPRLR